MASLLKIDVSPRGAQSYSRRLGHTFLKSWKAAHNDGSVVELDLAKDQPTYLDLQWIAGAFTPPDQHSEAHKSALKLSDRYISQIHAADHILITTPMYNFQIPAVLKAWIDHVVRVGVTVNYVDGTPVGQVAGKKVTVIVASGGAYGKGTPAESFDLLTPYVKHILGFIGITDVTFVEAGGAGSVRYGKITEEAFLQQFEQQVKTAAAA